MGIHVGEYIAMDHMICIEVAVCYYRVFNGNQK